MKRVGCLYRVSSAKQLYEDDIPVQRESCRNFLKTKSDWVLKKEYYEKGISGYKIKTNQRDVIIDIKRDVINDEIDILLVFLFDRIGRQEDETPFVVEWLVENGIEVWSVKEGQRKIENSTDRLMNYITYWNAEGESEKISIRGTEKRIQMIKDGIYQGHYAPYGYELIESETEKTKLGKKRRILKIFEKEAEIVRYIFKLVLEYGYGVEKIAKCLNKQNIPRRHEGVLWTNTFVSEIIRNPIYKGYVSFMKRTRRRDVPFTRNLRDTWILADKPNADIMIVSEDDWEKANDLIDSRRRKGTPKLRLLSGMVRCGYCGKSIVPRGREKYTYMVCKGRIETENCEYLANYRVDKLESIIIAEINRYLEKLERKDLKEIIKEICINQNEHIEKHEEVIKKIQNEEKRFQELKNKVIKTLMSGDEGEKKKLSEEIENKQQKIRSLDEERCILEKIIRKNNIEKEMAKQYIPEWKKEFNEAKLEVKREILSQLIYKIFLYNNRIIIQVKYPVENFIVREDAK